MNVSLSTDDPLVSKYGTRNITVNLQHIYVVYLDVHLVITMPI